MSKIVSHSSGIPENVPSDSMRTLTLCLKFMGRPMSISRVEEIARGVGSSEAVSMVRLRGRPVAPSSSRSAGEDRCFRNKSIVVDVFCSDEM